MSNHNYSVVLLVSLFHWCISSYLPHLSTLPRFGNSDPSPPPLPRIGNNDPTLTLNPNSSFYIFCLDEQNEDVHPHLKAVPLCSKHNKPPPPQPEHKQLIPCPDSQRTTDSRAPPKIPPRQVAAGTAVHANQETATVSGDPKGSGHILTRRVSDVTQKAVNKQPPPLPPRPTRRSSSTTSEVNEPSSAPHLDGHNLETQIHPSVPTTTTDPRSSARPSIKPKPKPKPRPKPKISVPEKHLIGHVDSQNTKDTGDIASHTDSETDKGLKAQEQKSTGTAKKEEAPSRPRIPVPRKRQSHSLSDMVERRLHIDHINLTCPPYSHLVSIGI